VTNMETWKSRDGPLEAIHMGRGKIHTVVTRRGTDVARKRQGEFSQERFVQSGRLCTVNSFGENDSSTTR
jgi:hypothetical protein